MGTSLPEVFARPVRDRWTSPAPGGRFLGNGRYRAFVTPAGTGESRWGDWALTRSGADRIEDRSGLFLYVRDLATGAFHTLGLEPIPGGGAAATASWRPGVQRFECERDGLAIVLEIAVDPHADVEIRRLTLTDTAGRARSLDVTSCAEVVLNHPAADAAHPAFSKLFVQTEFDPAFRTLLARRRPRGNDESPPWLAHAVLEPGDVQCESDRTRFVGRGRSYARPLALAVPGALSGTTGNVLDPVVALRRVLAVPSRGSATLTFALAAAATREEALAIVAGAAREPADVLGRAESHARATLRDAGVAVDAAEALQSLAGAIACGHPGLRAPAEQLERNVAHPGLLARLGLDPRRPLVLAWLDNGSSAAQLAALAVANRWWTALGFECGMLALAAHAENLPAPPGVVVLPYAALDPGELDALAALAHAVVSGPLDALAREVRAHEAVGPAGIVHAAAAFAPGPQAGAEDLREFNGHGGFTADGSEYVIRMPRDANGELKRPPLPWVNVIANDRFGFLVSETGAGSTWSLNSREHRLTPWTNDALLDPHGEALYLRDDETGAFGSPTAGPAPLPGAHEMRHGFGYSTARQRSDGLAHEVTTFVHASAPVRLTRWRLTNEGDRPRRLSLTSYARLVLGALPTESGRSVITEFAPGDDTCLARNPMAGEFAERVAFAAAVAPGAVTYASADRESFLGLGGSPVAPRAILAPGPLVGAFGAGLDPCFAVQARLELPAGATVTVTFLLGEAAGREQALALARELRAPGAVDAAFEHARAAWRECVSGVRIETPSPELDLMVNGWLAYQTLSCRIWGRTAFYQSGGAFGFRDQLQDASSLIMLRPDLTRAQILLHAAHQFVEGDVLHWWHPPLSKGMRTRFADDLLWLPFLTAHYVRSTGDWSVLDERARFLRAPLLRAGEDETFLVPEDSGQSADVYEHCCRAIDRSLATGAHGLPLFGTGDWNDGMNRVGREGRGESVWMGFFLHAILGDFASLCERRGDTERSARYERFRARMRVALNDAGWDGEWYRRAYYDDGAVLGSTQSDECRIDGLAQAWAVISKAAPPERAEMAMDAVERQLVSEREGLIRLLTPAFRNTPHDPGYIKGYVPGVRENGGQYTHAALWVVKALAELGRHERAAALLAMLSPVHHTRDEPSLSRYRTEPYVVVADVYGEPPHVGRGGWTWYTGSAGWMFRVALESVLGLNLCGGDTLRVSPCVPDAWPGFTVEWRLPGSRTTLTIVARRAGPGSNVRAARLDGAEVPVSGSLRVPLVRDERPHRLEIELGAGA